MTFYKWSQIASADANADASINWAEGQAPSSINDSARAMMAAMAKYRDDVTGVIVTTGSATAYAVATHQQFETLAQLHGQMIAFSPHTTNGNGQVTLNVDGLGPKALRTTPGSDLASGVIIQGTPYVVVFNNADGVFYLQSFFGNPYNVPISAGLDYFGSVAPNSYFAFPVGQAISRVSYAALFSLIGTTHGAGDGSTTFNLPDKRGRVSAGADAMGGAPANRLTSNYFGVTATNGAAGGADNHTLTTAELPSHSHPNSINDPGHSHSTMRYTLAGQAGNASGFYGTLGATDYGFTSGASSTGVTITNANIGGGGAHSIVQPTIVCNYILRIA